MSLEQLASEFLVDDEVGSKRLEKMIEKLLPFCLVRRNGAVEIVGGGLSGKDQVKLILSARLVASKLGGTAVTGDVTVDEVGQYTGLPRNQAAARAKECFDERFAERTSRGSYRARLHKLDDFLEQLSASRISKKDI
jgi:hypothetical protein